MSRFYDELNDDENSYRFSFTSGDGDRDFEMRINLPYDETWREVVTHFAGFLSNVYGYDIRDKIKFVD